MGQVCVWRLLIGVKVRDKYDHFSLKMEMLFSTIVSEKDTSMEHVTLVLGM